MDPRQGAGSIFGASRGDLRTRLLVHLPNFIKLYWRLFTDRRVSLFPKLILVAGLLYFVVPLDAIPDFPLVGLNQLDDLIVIIAALQLFVRLAPRRIVEEHVQLIDQGL